MKVKDHYNKDCAKLLSEKIKPSAPEFNDKDFVNYIDKTYRTKNFPTEWTFSPQPLNYK